MVSKVYVIGMGMGNPQTLTVQAQSALAQCELIIGSYRIISSLVDSPARKVCLVAAADIERELRSCAERVAGVVMSGDTGFFSGATSLFSHLDDFDVRVIPGISSLSYLCAKLRTPWQDVHVVSAHGRMCNVVGAVQSHEKTFVLVGGATTAQGICQQLVERDLGEVHVAVGDRLSYENERIVRGTAEQLAQESFDSLSVMLVQNPRPVRRDMATPHLADDEFVRGHVPMTKEEVREVALCKLRLRPDSVVWDVGAGTGSVSVEAARAAREGLVLAIEKDAEALSLLRANRERFALSNLRIVEGEAPLALAGLPQPDSVFVGGSSGRLHDILTCVLQANPQVRICIACVTLETLCDALACARNLALKQVEVVQIGVTKSVEAGSYHLMKAANPVYLISAGT